ncbi:MAG: insulinase family protein [Bermanella sp.]
MLTRNRTFFIAVILALVFSFTRSVMQPQPVTSSNDEKQYKYLQLSNQLRVLLISDPKADHGAASLDVNVGSLQDPQLRPGLAHFLEHMLFLGTESYPVAGDYQAFISQHGGRHNAFTAAEHTNYFFEIEHQQLQGALDRFSRFFYQPLFGEDYVQREKEAVNGEYKSKYQDDYRRIQYVLKSLMNPEHPASHFATGNLQTLSDNDNSKVRHDLLAFYKKYYSANLMTLTVYGSQDLATLEEWVTPLFNPIENRQSVVADYPSQLFPELPLDIQIQPVKQLYNLSFTFPLQQSLNYYEKKPSQYIGHILGHEGEGSLLAWLKQKGWAEGLSAGLHSKMRNNGAFQLNISLSQSGLQHIDEISEQVFAYIQLLQQAGPQEWVFAELKQLAAMEFTFLQGQNPSSLVQGLSMSMHEYSVADILQGPYLWQEFDKTLIQSLLNKLTPQNVVRTLVAPSVQGQQNETWFNAPYNKAQLAAELVEKWQAASLAEGLFLPVPNPFISHEFAILKAEHPDMKDTKPTQLAQQPGLDIWHLQDVSFKAPQSSIFISLRSPLPQLSAHHQVLLGAWVSLLNDHLNSFSYPASLAGQNYSLYSHMRGIGIRLYGYRDKQDVVLEKVVDAMLVFEPNEQQWQQTQQEMIRAYQNALQQKPYKRTITTLNQVMLQPSFNEAQLLAAIKSATRADVLAIKQQFFKELHLVMLGHGNIDEQQLLASSQFMQDKILNSSTPVVVKRKAVTQLALQLTEQPVAAQHADSAFTLYFQAQDDSSKERATLGLISQIIKAPYYTYMRTEREHGYIVFATAYPMLEQGGLALIVQSPKTPSKRLMSDSQAFLSDFLTTLKNMPAAEYAAHQQGLISNLLKKPQNLSEKSGRLWTDIDIENNNFDTLQTLAKEVQQLSKKEILAYMQNNLLGDNKKALLLTFDQS